MAGIKIALPAAFTTTGLPILRDDGILTVGSLLLVDPIHTANPWPAGTPASGFAVPNIAWKECAATIGSGTQSSLAGLLTLAGLTSSVAVFERSGKGGLHGIISQVNNTASNQGGVITMANAIRDYIFANSTHSYFFSYWGKVTRAGISSSPGFENAGVFNNTAAQTPNSLF